MANTNPTAANAQLQADPRYQSALQQYRATLARLPPAPTTTQQRNDDGGGGGENPAAVEARRAFAATVTPIVSGYHLPGQPQAWLIRPDGQLVYEEDHSTRNMILMMGGIVGGGLAAGALSGGGAAATAGGGGSGLVSGGAAGGVISTGAAGGGAAAAGGGTVAAGLGGASYGTLALNQGIGIGGQLLSSYLQSRAQGNASAIQDQYLQQALTYAKEQDALNRERQTGLDQQDRDRYAYSTGIDAQHYGDTQQEYLADFDRNENRYAYSTDLEASRYADYTKRAAPYLATGASANARMASLLGLPEAPAFDPSLTPGPVRKVSKPPVLSDPGSGFGGYSGGGGSGGGAQAPADVGAFIADYQRTHPASEGIGPLASALSAKFPGISRYMYGQTPSGNEISIGGQKYKVIGAEGGPNPYWYQPGTRDG